MAGKTIRMAGILLAAAALTAQNSGSGDADRAAMMRQLGITALVPGPSGDEQAPNHANYDEASANPYPALPDVLIAENGRRIATADAWWKVRRPEIVAAFSREIYGRVPKGLPAVEWRVVAEETQTIGFFRPVRVRQLVGHVPSPDGAVPAVDIRMTVVTPAAATQPVPLLIMFGRDVPPAPTQPDRAEAARIDAAMKALLLRQDPSLATVFARHPFFAFQAEQPFRFTPPGPGDPPREEQLIAAGWGYALLDPTSVQPDNADALRQGIIGLANRGKARAPDDWGALRAWAWGASRGFDWLAADPTIDARRIGIEGVSRYGKAALLAAAFDERFAMVLVGSSGKGGATLLRRNFGEAVANLATGQHYWMAGNFLKYNAASGKDPLDPGDLPVDSHQLIALVAPRLAFVSYGVPEAGDAKWLDQRGSLMATVAAGRVWRLLGARDLGLGDDWRGVQLPPVNSGLLDGELAWRQHDGGHTDQPNMKSFLSWANTKIGWVPQR
ncbi:hypothetical protein OKW76_03865 [Sphingomonas sp. S1-29]|uniref:glucuronyl esterase domain-containing protein n=1 Tax=Sphingomonas sp. S1-29 TaxID=2991074 RepID=UPI00223F7FEB|nr:hypothetical protein [Sphingomonas sp. S1-29]UZK70200.1 hypothetical protein OKW76_03865 [Sphingomonas sp. S1-29]